MQCASLTSSYCSWVHLCPPSSGTPWNYKPTSLLGVYDISLFGSRYGRNHFVVDSYKKVLNKTKAEGGGRGAWWGTVSMASVGMAEMLNVGALSRWGNACLFSGPVGATGGWGELGVFLPLLLHLDAPLPLCIYPPGQAPFRIDRPGSMGSPGEQPGQSQLNPQTFALFGPSSTWFFPPKLCPSVVSDVW